MISKKAKDKYWSAVEACLVEMFDKPANMAGEKCQSFRTRLEEQLPKDSMDMLYHDEPVYVACDILSRNYKLPHKLMTKYTAIRDKYLI